MSDQHHDLTKDDVLDLLSNSRRRYVIYLLERWGGTATLNQLAYSIAAHETGTAVEALSEDDKRRVYISLYQTHLPKLDLYDLVDYDKEGRTVRLTDHADDLGDYFFPESDERDSTVATMLAVALAGAAATTLGLLDLVAPGTAMAVALLATLLVAGLAAVRLTVDGDEAVFDWLVDDMEPGGIADAPPESIPADGDEA